MTSNSHNIFKTVYALLLSRGRRGNSYDYNSNSAGQRGSLILEV